MITEKEAIEKVTKYSKNRSRGYFEIITDRVNYIDKEIISYGKYEGDERSVFVVTCHLEGYHEPISHYITVDAQTGEVLYSITPQGYAEDWEE